MKTFIYFITILLLASACKKITNSNDPVVIEGILMASCDVPAANKSGFIITDDGLLSGPGISLSFTTDEKGYFKITHTGKESMDKFTVRVQGSSDVLRVTNLSGNTKNLGKVYINPPRSKYYLKLQVHNAYTSSDTLTYSNGGWPFNNRPAWIKISGPFNSGVIDTILFSQNATVMPLSYSHYITGIFPTNTIGFYLNEYNSENLVSIEIPSSYCDTNFHDAVFVID